MDECMEPKVECDHDEKNVEMSPAPAIIDPRKYPELHKCGQCSYAGTSLMLLRRHNLRKHINKETVLYNCAECRENFVSKFDLRQHMLRSHSANRKLFHCTKCSYICTEDRDMKRHSDNKHIIVNKVDFVNCERCSYKTKNLMLLRKHIRRMHDDSKAVIMCSDCDIEFISKYDLNQHVMKSHRRGLLYRCKHCEYVSDMSRNYINHMQDYHRNGGLFECGLCKYTSPVFLDFRTHFYEHSKSSRTAGNSSFLKSMQSVMPGLTGPLKALIKTEPSEHTGIHSNKSSSPSKTLPKKSMDSTKRIGHDSHEPIESSCLANSLSEQSDVKVDVTQHTGAGLINDHDLKPSLKDIAEEYDAETESLDGVEWKHMMETDFSIKMEKVAGFEGAEETCDNKYNIHQPSSSKVSSKRRANSKSFSQSRRVRTKRSNSEEIYTCTDCGVESRSKFHLNQHHMKTHSNQQLFSCTYCEYVHTMEHNVKRHMKFHEYKKGDLQKCTRCSYVGRNPSLLKRHFRTMHVKHELLTCTKCDFESFSKLDMKKHIMTVHYADSLYRCTMCDYVGATMRNYVRHTKLLHKDAMAYHCDQCEFSCKLYITMRKHKKEHKGKMKKQKSPKPTSGVVFNCQECKFKTKLSTDFKAHVAEHQVGDIHECSECEKRFNSLFHIKKHMIEHMGSDSSQCIQTENQACSSNDNQTKEKPDIKQLQCLKCNFKCLSPYDMKKHVREHKTHYPYKCLHCDYKCSHKARLTSHIRKHTGEKPYSCNDCDAKFSLMSSLKKHTLVKHTEGPKPYQCDQCAYSCVTSFGLKRHLRAHQDRNLVHTCSKCYTTFTTKRARTIHARFVHGIHEKHVRVESEKHQCDLCGRVFTHRNTLKQHHLSKHTTEKPFLCTTCAFSCKTAALLRRHMVQHSGFKSYVCTECGNRFYHRCDLTIHIRRTHKKEKNYTCEHCGYKCFSSGTMTRHSFIHTGVKPYACEICDYRSIFANHIKVHMRTHTGHKPFQCHLCSYCCTTNGALKGHVAKVHALVMPQLIRDYC